MKKILGLLGLVILLFSANFVATSIVEPIYFTYFAWSPDSQQIYFTSNLNGQSDIWSAQADGGNLVNLTEDLEGEHYYSLLSPNGKYITFYTDRFHNEIYETTIWVMNYDGSNPIQVTPDSMNTWSDVSWSPDSQHLIFSSYEAPNNIISNSIWIYDLKTEELNYFTEGQIPVWSPNGEWIAYFNPDDDLMSDLYLMSAETLEQQIIPLYINSTFRNIVWSPDGRYIAAIDGTDEYAPFGNAWLVDTADFQPKQLSTNDSSYALNWLPNSQTLVIFDRDEGELNLLLVDIATGKQKPQTLEQNISSLAWSSDGKKAIISQGNSIGINQRPESDIWMMDIDGSNLSNLTADTDIFAIQPKFSPDGNKILFGVATPNDSYEMIAIWVMDIDGSNMIQLTPERE